MSYVTDLHLHSHYSRAVSKHMTLPVMAEYAVKKGINILSAADFTHPRWFKEISELLTEKTEGFYSLREGSEKEKQIYFLLSAEISCIYKQNEKVRRIHVLIFAPNLKVAGEINKALVKRGGNLSSDGRPIIGLSAKHVLELLLTIDERIFLIPCHIWTPHFGLYGSASGFDSITECFEDMSEYIYGIETGLSSDPEMNWEIPELKNRTILSFSDAHSPMKMGREVTVVTLAQPTYTHILQAFQKPKQTVDTRILYTVEFHPEEGKYHFSGHRNCGVSVGPDKVRAEGNICPVCKRRMTEGVVYRVQQLAEPTFLHRLDQKNNENGLLWFTDKAKEQPPYLKLVPLNEIIAEAIGVTVGSKKVKEMYDKACHMFGSEIEVLLRVPLGSLTSTVGENIAEAVGRVRKGAITVVPGFDGEYGKIRIWEDEEVKKRGAKPPQLRLEL